MKKQGARRGRAPIDRAVEEKQIAAIRARLERELADQVIVALPLDLPPAVPIRRREPA
jgi:hypothetical protein